MKDRKSNLLGNAGTIIGAGATLASALGIGNKAQDKRQVRQQRALNQVNAETSKELADYEQALKMKMWQDTNYGAQLKQAEMAGVSKAAAIGGGGAGVGQGASVSASGTGQGAADAAQTQQANINQQMAMAQISNLNADTELKKANADVTSGVGKDKTEQEIVNMKLDAQWKELDNKIKGRTMEDVISIVQGEVAKQENEIMIGKDEVGQRINTYEERIGHIRSKAMQTIIENAAIRQGIKLDEARTAEIANNIKMRAEELKATYSGQEVSRENMENLTNTMLIQAGIHATGTVLKGFTDIMMKKRGTTTTNTNSKGRTRTTTTRQN